MRLKITSPAILRQAESFMPVPPFYCQRNAWQYIEWLKERNRVADLLLKVKHETDR